MKILHLHTELNKTCGISKSIFLLAKKSSPEMHQSIFTLGGDNINFFVSNGIPVSIHSSIKYSPFSLLKLINQIIKKCKKENIDILHAHNRYFDFLAFLVSKIITIKRITSVHSKVYHKKWLSYKSPKLIAASNSVRNHLINNFNIPVGKIVVINNFIDDNKEFVFNPLTGKENIPIDKKNILFIGRFCMDKGVDILLEVYKILQTKRNDINLILLGAGEAEQNIRSFIKKNELTANIIAPRENTDLFYQSAYLVVLPSRVDPFPLVMLEAGIMSKPFIGGAVDGIAEFIEDGKDGLLVKPGSIEELLHAVIKILDNPVMAEELGRKLYEKVTEKCSVNAVMPLYQNIYREVLSYD